MDEKSSGHFGGASRGRRFSRQLMPKIDKPSERELMEKKREERGEKVATRGGKTRSPRNANIRVAGVSTRDVRKRAFEHIVARRALFPPRNAAN